MHVTTYCKGYPLPDGQVLVLNTLSGALDIVRDEVWAWLRDAEGARATALAPELAAALRERGYVFDSPEAEQQQLDALAAACFDAQRREPVQFVVCPTFACNMTCRYCFEGPLTQQPGRVMEDAEVALAFQAMDRIQRELYPDSPAALLLFGGEPLMASTRRCVELVLREAARRPLSVNAATNGLEAAEVLAALPEDVARVHHVQITVDGVEEVHDRRRALRDGAGSFDRIVHGIGVLLQRGVAVTVRVNVDSDNIEALPELIEYMEDRGWLGNPKLSCYVFPVTGRAGAERARLLSEDEAIAALQRVFRSEGKEMPAFVLHGFKVLAHVANVLEPDGVQVQTGPLMRYCEATALKYFAFGPDGLIYPCGQTIGRGEAYAIGTYAPEFSLWRDRCQAWSGRHVRSIEKCRTCRIATLCGGGCAMEAFTRARSFDTPNCHQAEAAIDRYITGWIERVHGTV